jgi:hypothetical protein
VLEGGERQVLVVQPHQHLAHAAELQELVEHHPDRLLDPPIRMQFDPAIRGPPQPSRQRELERAPLGLRANGFLGALPEQAELILADAALHAQDQPVVGQREVVDLIEIGHQGGEESAELEELGPVLRVAGEARGFETQDHADVPQGDLRDQVLEAGPMCKAGGRDAEVIYHGDRLQPAEGDRLVA